MGFKRPVVEQILTIVGRKGTPQVGSLLPVGLSTISNGHTSTIRVCENNYIIGVNDLVLAFSAWRCSMHK